MKTTLLLIASNLLVLTHAAVIDQTSATVNVQQGGQQYSYTIRETHGEVPQDPHDKQRESKVSEDDEERLPEVVSVLQPQLHLVPEQPNVPQEQSKGEKDRLLGVVSVLQPQLRLVRQVHEQLDVPQEQSKAQKGEKERLLEVVSVLQPQLRLVQQVHEHLNVQQEQSNASRDEKGRLPGLEVVKILQPQLRLVQQVHEQLDVQREQLKVQKVEGQHLVLGIPQEKGLVYPQVPQFVKHPGSGGFFRPLGFYFLPGLVRLV